MAEAVRFSWGMRAWLFKDRSSSASSRATMAKRRSGERSRSKARCSSGVGSSPQRLKYTRRRNAWSLTSAGGLPRCGRGRGRAALAFVDPARDDCDLGGRQRRGVLRHLVAAHARDAMDDQAVRAVAGPDGRPVLAAFEDVFIGLERQAALALVAARSPRPPSGRS